MTQEERNNMLAYAIGKLDQFFQGWEKKKSSKKEKDLSKVDNKVSVLCLHTLNNNINNSFFCFVCLSCSYIDLNAIVGIKNENVLENTQSHKRTCEIVNFKSFKP